MRTLGIRWPDAILFTVACAASVFGAEATLRVLDRGRGPEIGPGGNHPRGLFVPRDRTGYGLRPGFVGTMRNAFGDFQVPITIDADGNRSKAGETESPEFVVLGVGDSFTYGEGVSSDSTYLSLVETALESEHGMAIRTIAAGVPGYSARQMLLRAREILEQERVDLVVLGLAPSGGDRLDDPFMEHSGFIVRTSASSRIVFSGERFVETVAPTGPLRDIEAFLKARLLLARRLASWGRPATAPGDPYAELRRSRSGAWADSMRAIVGEFLILCRDRAATPCVVLVDSTREQEDAVLPILARSGVVHVALAEDFASHERRAGEPLVFEHDDHWNEAGHRFVAARIVRALASNDQISTSSPKSSFTSSPSRSSRT